MKESKLTFSRGKDGKSCKIDIIGPIGWDFFDEGMSYPTFKKKLYEFEDADLIMVEINSDGGVIPDGIAMANALADFPGTIHCYINGIAASIASVVAMAADKVFIPSNSILMAHKPWSGIEGNADDMRKQAVNLDIWESAIKSIYMKRGTDLLTMDKLTEFLKEEKRFTADEAKEYFSNVQVLDGLGQPIMNMVKSMSIYDSASYIAQNSKKETEMAGDNKIVSPSREEFNALDTKVSAIVDKMDKVLNAIPSKEVPEEVNKKQELSKMPKELDASNPEEVKKYLEGVKKQKALDEVDWSNDASIQKYYDSLVAKPKEPVKQASNQGSGPIVQDSYKTDASGKSEFSQLKSKFADILK